MIQEHLSQEGEVVEPEKGGEDRAQIERVLQALETARAEAEKAALHFEGKVTEKKRFRSPDTPQHYGEVLRNLERDIKSYMGRFRDQENP